MNRAPIIFASLTLALTLAACDRRESAPPSDLMAAESGDALPLPRVAPPAAVAPTVAPGVAFNYRYDFRLAADRIAQAQERHAQACEKLGVDRCRVTGMSYRLSGDEDVSAMLAFRLEPGLARQFGKDGIAAITEAEGMLLASEISGVDEGANIAAAAGAETRLAAERARLEARLAGRLSDDERARLTSELAELRRQLDASRTGRASSERALAGTPMVFNYSSGAVVFRGFSQLGEAFRTAGETMIGALSALIVVLGALLPLALLGLILALLWRLARRPLARMRAEPAEA